VAQSGQRPLQCFRATTANDGQEIVVVVGAEVGPPADHSTFAAGISADQEQGSEARTEVLPDCSADHLEVAADPGLGLGMPTGGAPR